MKRILYVSTISRFLRDFLLPYASYFRRHGWQVDGMCSGVSEHPICSSHFDNLWEVQWSRNPLNPRNLLCAPCAVKEIVQREEYDLVHVHTPVASLVTRYALRGCRAVGKPKVIYTAHGFHFHPQGRPLRNSLFLHLEKFAGRWTDYLVVINQDDHLAATRHGIVPPTSLVYMPGIGVDLQYYNERVVSPVNIEGFRKEIGINTGDPLFAKIARDKRFSALLNKLFNLDR